MIIVYKDIAYNFDDAHQFEIIEGEESKILIKLSFLIMTWNDDGDPELFTSDIKTDIPFNNKDKLFNHITHSFKQGISVCDITEFAKKDEA